MIELEKMIKEKGFSGKGLDVIIVDCKLYRCMGGEFEDMGYDWLFYV